jgi:RNA polymerase sigma-70 factor (ECF subfamily)
MSEVLRKSRPESIVDPASDACLVRQLVDGSEEALALLYDKYSPAVFAKVTRTSGDKWLAAEVVQETFLALWNRAELFDQSRGTLLAWLLTIARNRAVDHLRHASRHDRAATFSSFRVDDAMDVSTTEWLAAAGEPIAMAAPEPRPEVALLSNETRRTVVEALASLAPVERSVIALAYDEGLSQSEIADRLGWPVGTVKTRTRRALRHLRDRFEPRQGAVHVGDAEVASVVHERRRPSDLGEAAVRSLAIGSRSTLGATSSCHA